MCWDLEKQGLQKKPVSLLLFFKEGSALHRQEIKNCLEISPVIAAVQDNMLDNAIKSPVEIIFLLKSSLIKIEKDNFGAL